MALLSYEFMRRAFLAAIFIAGIAPMLGVFLVIRRQSLMADTLSHVSLAGVALGFFLNLNPTGTTLLVVVVAAIVTITWQQVVFLGILFVLVGILFLLFKRPMYVLTFDEDIAAVDGLPVRMMSMIFNVVTGVAIAIMIPIAGALLISAIMVLPAAIGMRVGKSFNIVIFVSVFVGFIGMIGGLTGSYYLDTPPGATITLGFILLFLIVNGIRQFRIMIQRRQVQK